LRRGLDYTLVRDLRFSSLRAAMILTAQNPASGSPAIPLSFLEEVGRVLSQHKAVRVHVAPEDEAVTVEEAAKLLGAKAQLVREMLHMGVLERAEVEGAGGTVLVRLDSLLAFQKEAAQSPRNGLDEIFDEVESAGLC